MDKFTRQLVALKIKVDKIKESASFDMGKLEKKWDVESAYNSSCLEGSMISRKSFDRIANNVMN